MDEQAKLRFDWETRKVGLRQWAVEQAVHIHAEHGRTLEVVLADAEKLLAFVRGSDDPTANRLMEVG